VPEFRKLAEKIPFKPDQVSTCARESAAQDLEKSSILSLIRCYQLIRNTILSNRLTLAEIIFICIIASTLGIAWWAYSLIYDILSPILKPFGLSGLLEGFWHMGGIFFAYIIRKPGSAVLGETIAATVEGLISQWGFSAVVSGLCQGLPVELLFLASRYKVWNKLNCALAGILSACGGYIVTYYWYGYASLGLKYNLINLGCTIISGAILGGLLSRYLANQLATTGVLNQYKISHE